MCWSLYPDHYELCLVENDQVFSKLCWNECWCSNLFLACCVLFNMIWWIWLLDYAFLLLADHDNVVNCYFWVIYFFSTCWRRWWNTVETLLHFQKYEFHVLVGLLYDVAWSSLIRAMLLCDAGWMLFVNDEHEDVAMLFFLKTLSCPETWTRLVCCSFLFCWISTVPLPGPSYRLTRLEIETHRFI